MAALKSIFLYPNSQDSNLFRYCLENLCESEGIIRDYEYLGWEILSTKSLIISQLSSFAVTQDFEISAPPKTAGNTNN